jgi:3-(3-hydroxy-phenyl)propionate hydroxylase
VAIDVDGLVASRHDLRAGNALLFRPDRHVCARWRHPNAQAVKAALRRAVGLAPEGGA